MRRTSIGISIDAVGHTHHNEHHRRLGHHHRSRSRSVRGGTGGIVVVTDTARKTMTDRMCRNTTVGWTRSTETDHGGLYLKQPRLELVTQGFGAPTARKI